jgi:hypothetical protein
VSCHLNDDLVSPFVCPSDRLVGRYVLDVVSRAFVLSIVLPVDNPAKSARKDLSATTKRIEPLREMGNELRSLHLKEP